MARQMCRGYDLLPIGDPADICLGCSITYEKGRFRAKPKFTLLQVYLIKSILTSVSVFPQTENEIVAWLPEVHPPSQSVKLILISPAEAASPRVEMTGGDQ